jgi:UDP-N-acetylmuramoylalanine--D-glutamate ligase
MKIAIVGFDLEGRATYDFFVHQDAGHEITICDRKLDLAIPEGTASVLGDAYLDDLDRFDLIIRTAGMKPSIILDKNPTVASKMSSHINEFFKATPTNNIIGITGTKGKGTTSTLTAKMLEAGGKDVRIGGNIGIPPLTFIDELDADSWVVLELSSYQLSDLKHSPHIAVCLLIAPEHLDWHGTYEDYITAKEQLFARQGTADVAIYYHDSPDSKRIAGAGQAQKVPYFHSPGAEVIDGKILIDGNEICRTDELKLLGEHNWQNACAAVTAFWYACLEVCGPADAPDIQAVRSVLTSFSGLPYRIEFRREVNGLRYYNDSFSSTPIAPIAALRAIPGKQVLIVGGFDRMLDLHDMTQGLKDNAEAIRKIMVIGAASERIAQAFSEQGFDNYTVIPVETMTDIVHQASSLAEAGDAIVLSPGFASFDMFKNFEDRGRQFNEVVDSL